MLRRLLCYWGYFVRKMSDCVSDKGGFWVNFSYFSSFRCLFFALSKGCSSWPWHWVWWSIFSWRQRWRPWTTCPSRATFRKTFWAVRNTWSHWAPPYTMPLEHTSDHHEYAALPSSCRCPSSAVPFRPTPPPHDDWVCLLWWNTNLIFTSFTTNKTTSVAKCRHRHQPHLPYFSVQ